LREYEGLIEAVFHHDDGWAAWEQRPDVDPESGQPLDFTEMPLAAALRIWRESIAAADAFGSWAAWCVSAHFTTLQRRFAKADEPPARRALADEFLAEQDASQARWLADWIHGPRPARQAIARNRAAADRALAYLQLFDALSLWLCCAPRGEPLAIDVPQGPPVTFTPTPEGWITIAPWPFRVPELPLSTTGREVRATRYADAADLAAAPARAERLDWRFVPGD
jgi:hypothetical protein